MGAVVIFDKIKNNNRATSPVMGVLMMVAIVVVLAAVIAGFALSVRAPEHTPQAFIGVEDASIYEGATSSIQRIILYHKGGDSFNVSDIRVTIAVNGIPLPNGLDALPATSGVTGFNGLGGVFHNWTGGAPVWEVGEKASINIALGAITLSAGDKVTVIIVYKPSKMIIARPSAIVQDLR